MIKKLLFSLIFAGSLVGLVPTVQAGVTPEKINNAADAINEKLGTLSKDKKKYERSGARDMVEQLTLAFYFAGKDTDDGKFDVLKGANGARDGFQKVAMEILACKTMKKFLEANEKIGSQFFRDHQKIWAKIGLDFFLNGVKYANGSDKNKSFAQYLKNDFVPHFVRKAAVYSSLRGLKSGTYGALSQYAPTYVDALIKMHRASFLIPFIGVIIEDAPEDMFLKPLYDKGLAKAKVLAATIKSKLSTAQPAVAA